MTEKRLSTAPGARLRQDRPACNTGVSAKKARTRLATRLSVAKPYHPGCTTVLAKWHEGDEASARLRDQYAESGVHWSTRRIAKAMLASVAIVRSRMTVQRRNVDRGYGWARIVRLALRRTTAVVPMWKSVETNQNCEKCQLYASAKSFRKNDVPAALLPRRHCAQCQRHNSTSFGAGPLCERRIRSRTQQSEKPCSLATAPARLLVDGSVFRVALRTCSMAHGGA